MNVIHISTECYPAAKAGGMGDVVGSLPKYLAKFGVKGSVLIPKYSMPWFQDKEYREVWGQVFQMGAERIHYSIQLVTNANLGFDLYVADIPGKFDRNSIYLDYDGEGYRDEVERNISFQTAALHFLNNNISKFDLVHCHDHMTGLIPFFMKFGLSFRNLVETPTFFSIHNAAYHGRYSWFHRHNLPAFYAEHSGLIDWDDHIHGLAAAVKCATKVNTVSPSYMQEIREMPNSLSYLFKNEEGKSMGILNGIDNESWDPKTDPLIDFNRGRSWDEFKNKNKEAFGKEYGLDTSMPWFSFIGRFSGQKGVDLIPPAVHSILESNRKACFIILGTGSKDLEDQIISLQRPGRVKALIMYNEAVAHKIYAASDFMMMPSRFEPCGLNQMFAMRYGTVPVVRATGGLKDTVIEDPEVGTGFLHADATAKDLQATIIRALEAYEGKTNFKRIRTRCVRKNFSWEKSAETYANEYKKLVK